MPVAASFELACLVGQDGQWSLQSMSQIAGLDPRTLRGLVRLVDEVVEIIDKRCDFLGKAARELGGVSASNFGERSTQLWSMAAWRRR